MNAHIARARCSCENTLWLCDKCMEVVREQGVADMSPPPRNWRFLAIALVVVVVSLAIIHWASGFAR
jgi:hypothetical protein